MDGPIPRYIFEAQIGAVSKKRTGSQGHWGSGWIWKELRGGIMFEYAQNTLVGRS